jgi:hypothetical protein
VNALRTQLGWALVGALSIVAATAIFALLGGGFDGIDWRIIGTSTSFGLFSATAAAGESVRRLERVGAAKLGALTLAASALAFALTVLLLWGPRGTDSEWPARAWGCAALGAVAGSHACVLLRSRRAGDPPAVATAARAALALVALDSLLGSLSIAGLFDVDRVGVPYVKLMGAVLVLLLRRLAPAPAPGPFAAPRRASALEQLANAVVAATERIEDAAHPDDVRRECRSLRELARSLAS